MYRYFLTFFALLTHTATCHAQILVGIAGGTGSGKTTLAEKIAQHFGNEAILIQQDSYYKDLSNYTEAQRAAMNFDHPDSLDFSLMKSHLLELKNDKTIEKPKYDFVTHTRKGETEFVEPKKLILVEGILVLAIPELRDIFDIKVFIETDDDVRILRRLERDLQERGRSFDSVKLQYLSTVKPMHKMYVEPSRDYADIILYGINENIPVITNLIMGYLEQKEGPEQSRKPAEERAICAN